jgi:hypothetical protein
MWNQPMTQVKTSNQLTDVHRVIVQKRSAQQQDKDAKREQKTYDDENDREINVGVNLLHDYVYHGMKQLF